MASLLDSFNLSRKQPWHLPSRSYSKLTIRSRIWLWFSVGAFVLLASGYFIHNHQRPPPPPPAPEVKLPRKRPDYEYVEANAIENSNKGRYAYATWLSNTAEPEDTKPSDGYYHSDLYFTATRLLVWQLLHDPKTKTNGIDVVVMVGPHVSQADRDRLTKDGAIVRPVELVHGKNDSWIVPMESRWADVMGKLRAWQMTEYEKVVMLDTDTVLQSSLDGVFDDPGATNNLRTRPDSAADVTSSRKEDEPELPDSYLLSSYVEIQTDRHSWPPVDPTDILRPGYFNAGFFMLRPDQKLFEYFVALLDLEGRFGTACPEQDLLNYAFRWDGPMPWREVSHIWNIRLTSPADLKGGVVSMHEKFWRQHTGGQELKDLLCSKRWQMEGYYLGLEAGLSQGKS